MNILWNSHVDRQSLSSANEQTLDKHMALTHPNSDTEVMKVAKKEMIPPEVRFQNDLRLTPRCSGVLGLEHLVIPALQTGLYLGS